MHPRIRQQIGDDTIRQVLGHLARATARPAIVHSALTQSRWKPSSWAKMMFVRLHPTQPQLADGATSAPIPKSVGMKWLEMCRRLFTRQPRIVHGVLARVLLAAQVGWVVQAVRSCRADSARWNDRRNDVAGSS